MEPRAVLSCAVMTSPDTEARPFETYPGWRAICDSCRTRPFFEVMRPEVRFPINRERAASLRPTGK